jgi:hypothetical protein
MQTMRLLLSNQVDHKTAALLFYGLQTASTNLRHTKFEPRPEQVVIDPRRAPDTLLGDNAWYKEEFEDKEQEEDQEEEREDAHADAEASADIPATVDLQAMAQQWSPALAKSRVPHPCAFCAQGWDSTTA